MVKSFMKRLGIENFPNCTDVRKAGEMTLSGMSSKDMALLSEHMTHSTKVKNSHLFMPCYSPVLALTIGASLLPFPSCRKKKTGQSLAIEKLDIKIIYKLSICVHISETVGVVITPMQYYVDTQLPCLCSVIQYCSVYRQWLDKEGSISQELHVLRVLQKIKLALASFYKNSQ